MANSVFLNYGLSYFDLLSQRVDDNEAEIVDVDFAKLSRPDPSTPNALIYITSGTNETASSTILCQNNNALQNVNAMQMELSPVNPASVIPELAGQETSTVWMSSVNGHLYRGSVDLEAGGGGSGGDVVGPASSADNAIARYNGTTGKIIQDSAIRVSDLGTMDFSLESSMITQNAKPAYYMDRINKIMGLGTAKGLAATNTIQVGVSDETSFNTANAVVVGNTSCEISSGAQSDLIAVGNQIGTNSGSANIAVGNRISQAPSVSLSLGESNLAIGHDISIRNTSLSNILLGNDVGVRGNANVVVGELGLNAVVAAGASASNVLVGHNVASKVASTCNNNVIIGAFGLSNAVSSSSSNILIGGNIGDAITTSVNNCIWLEDSGINGEANTTRIGKDKEACYISGIYNTFVGDRSLCARVDSAGKLFSSSVARPTARISYGVGNIAIALTSTPLEFNQTSTFEQYSDNTVFTSPSSGRVAFAGLFSGDTTTRKFRVTFVLNHAPMTTDLLLTFAINGTPFGTATKFFKSSASVPTERFVTTVEDFVTLTPGDYVSVFAYTTTSANLNINKYGIFVDLLA